MSLNNSPGTPSGWKRPEDVMKLHRLKLKQKALNARLCGGASSTSTNNKTDSALNIVPSKTINPFRKCLSDTSLKSKTGVKRNHTELVESEEVANDGSLFKILDSKKKSNLENIEQNVNFQNILNKISLDQNQLTAQDINQHKGFNYIPIDWTIRSKMRLMSKKPFPWNQKLKTCEEASGITGFVRCLHQTSSSTQCSTLDTSPNAQFLQTCMYWSHPHLPWLQLFPRTRLKTANNTQLSSSNAANVLSNDMKTALHKDWVKSFMSLFHLLRAKQCPYFYLVSNSFTCLFRAAGIGGHTELHAMLTPTTRGFRHLLKTEDIEYTMPLKNQNIKQETKISKRKKVNDPTLEPLEQTQMEMLSDEEDDLEQDDIEDDLGTENWLKEMGVANNDIRKIQNTQTELIMDEEKEVDRTPESLIYVEGTEAQALFNFLVNCKSCISTTGHLAGVPPTLISPVAFHSASLQYLQVKDSIVRLEGDIYYSMEVRGPILPHMVQYVCELLEKSQETFSLTFASVESTKTFSKVTSDQSNTPSDNSLLKSPRRNASSSIFEQQNLSDCGLRKHLIAEFCNQKRIYSYDSLKYSNHIYKVV